MGLLSKTQPILPRGITPPPPVRAYRKRFGKQRFEQTAAGLVGGGEARFEPIAQRISV